MERRTGTVEEVGAGVAVRVVVGTGLGAGLRMGLGAGVGGFSLCCWGMTEESGLATLLDWDGEGGIGCGVLRRRGCTVIHAPSDEVEGLSPSEEDGGGGGRAAGGCEIGGVGVAKGVAG